MAAPCQHPGWPAQSAGSQWAQAVQEIPSVPVGTEKHTHAMTSLEDTGSTSGSDGVLVEAGLHHQLMGESA